MAKLKWRKDKTGNIFDIRDGNSTFVISKVKNDARCKRKICFRHYGFTGMIPTKSLSSAKRIAEEIHNG